MIKAGQGVKEQMERKLHVNEKELYVMIEINQWFPYTGFSLWQGRELSYYKPSQLKMVNKSLTLLTGQIPLT